MASRAAATAALMVLLPKGVVGDIIWTCPNGPNAPPCGSNIGDLDGNFEGKTCFPMTEADIDHGAQRYVWDTSGGGLAVGQFLDDFIKKHGAKDWSTALDNKYFTNGQSNLLCNDFGASCEPHDCSDCETDDQTKAYWVQQALVDHYHLVDILHEYLQDETIETALDSGKIIDTFGEEPDEETNALALLSSMLVMGSFVGAVNPVVAGIAPLCIGAANIANQFQGDEKDKAGGISDGSFVKHQIKVAFASLRDGLSSMLKISSSGEDNDGNTVDDIPGQGPWATSIAKYFDGGRFLLPGDNLSQDASAAAAPYKEQIGKAVKQIAVVAALKRNHYFAFIQDWHTKDDCKGDKGLKWVDKHNACVDFWHYDEGSVAGYANGGHSDEIDKIQSEDFGSFDLEELYENAITCAKAHPDGSGKVNPDEIELDGSLPPCFYNIPVFKGDRKDNSPYSHPWKLTTDDENPLNTIPSDKWSYYVD